MSLEFRDAPISTRLNENLVLFLTITWYANFGIINSYVYIHFFTLSKKDYMMTGLLSGIPYILIVGTTFFFGWLSDKKGEIIVLFISFISLVTSNLVYSMIDDSLMFLLAFLFFNLLMSSYGPALQRIASRVAVKRDIFGKIGATSSLGYLIGSISGGILFDLIGMNSLFITGAFFGMIGIGGLVLLKHFTGKNLQVDDTSKKMTSQGAFSKKVLVSPDRAILEDEQTNDHVEETNLNVEKNTGTKKKNSLKLVFRKILIYNVVSCYLVLLIFYFGNSLSSSFVSIYLIDELHFPASVWGVINGIATILGMMISYLFGKYLSGKFKLIMGYSILMYVVVYIAFVISKDGLILAIFYSLPAYAGIIVAVPTLIASHVEEDVRGTAMGIASAIQSFSIGMGAMVGGMLGNVYKTFHENFLVSVIINLIAFVLMLLLIKDLDG